MITLSTDSGRMVTLEYLDDTKELKTIHYETYGKSAIRRVIPGEYLAVEPRGRAVMVASVEKNKLVYILTRAGADITISSPLEAHKPSTLLYNLVALDVAYDNPVFAALEIDFSQVDSDSTGEAIDLINKELVYYELDLGLNHVVRKFSENVDRTCNILFRVPGGQVGGDHRPGGVLCCGADTITYRFMDANMKQIHRVAIPRREGATEDPNRKRIIVSGTSGIQTGGTIFFWLQTEDGDIFIVTLEREGKSVQGLRIQYYDTIPVTTSMCNLKSGYLYCTFEAGSREVYEYGFPDGSEETFESLQFPVDPSEPYDAPFFRPRPLKYLTPMSTLPPSIGPILAAEVANLTMEDAPQIYTACGSGSRSTFRTLRNAMDVTDLIETHLPAPASSVWTSKLRVDDEIDSIVVMSMNSGSTLILRISDEVNQAFDSGLIEDTTTLQIQQFGLECLIQVHPKGIRHIRGLDFPTQDADGNEVEDGHATIINQMDWNAPQHRTVVACASNNRQVALAMSSGDIYYFECDEEGELSKADEEINLDFPITCLAIPEVPEGSVRAFFMAVGCADQSVRIYNLSPDMNGEILQMVSVQMSSAQPSAMIITSMEDNSPNGMSQYLHVGLRSGIYIRSYLDETTGEVYGTQRRFLGPEPIRFAEVVAAGKPAVVAITSRPWLSYTDPRTNTIAATPLHYPPFDAAAGFSTSQFVGIVTVRGDSLR